MDLDYKEIGCNIRKYRKQAGLSQKELADIVNLSSQHISHIENGYTKLSLPSLVAIADALSIDCNSLLGNTLTKSQEKILLQKLTPIFEDMSISKRKLFVKIAQIIVESED